jgi:hypothetical protein
MGEHVTDQPRDEGQYHIRGTVLTRLGAGVAPLLSLCSHAIALAT